MMDNMTVGTQSIIALGIGALLAIFVPVATALIWKFRKKERFTTILIGAATFVLFALLLEKIIQNVLIFPTQMGLQDHAFSRFVNARPLLWSLIVALFPGVFEETGRLVAFKTVLRKRKNRETAISHGIGHGGVEVMILLGVTYIEYVVFAIMINLGVFQSVIDQVAAQAPDQVGTLNTLIAQIASFSFVNLGVAVVERIFAVLFHIAASILVFYACRDRKRFWLYPLAIVLHTGLDFIAALTIQNIFTPSPWALEAIIAVYSLLTFCGAYFLLYRRDRGAA